MREGIGLFVGVLVLALFLQAHAMESAAELYIRANDLFQSGANSPEPERSEKIRQAARLYERIIAEKRIRNGHLYYNLGNCHFHLGHIGQAILNYRRAEKLIPNDADLKQNLRSARSRRTDTIQNSQVRSISQTLFFWHYRLSLRTKLLLFSATFSLLWMVLLVRLFSPRVSLRWLAALSLLFATVFGASAAVESLTAGSRQSGVILAETSVPRKGPGESYAESFKEPLHEGTEFRLRERQGEWVRVELDNGIVCWLRTRDVGFI
jgi:tetratricopeptide (TPR) repeat protein